MKKFHKNSVVAYGQLQRITPRQSLFLQRLYHAGPRGTLAGVAEALVPGFKARHIELLVTRGLVNASVNLKRHLHTVCISRLGEQVAAAVALRDQGREENKAREIWSRWQAEIDDWKQGRPGILHRSCGADEVLPEVRGRVEAGV